MLRRILRAISGSGRKSAGSRRPNASPRAKDYLYTSHSPDGTYVLAWNDLEWVGDETSSSRAGPGSYQLIRLDSIIASGRLQRPNDGKVANNGNFVFNDWLQGHGPAGEFVAIRSDGSVILRHRFSANLSANAISDSGDYALCTTLASEGRDSESLAFFDLDTRQLLWQRPIVPMEPESFRIDSDKQSINLVFEKLGQFAWSFEGVFLDGQKWRSAVLEHGDPSQVQVEVKAVLSDAGASPDRELFTLCLTALDRILGTKSERWHEQSSAFEAMTLRLKGELLEALGQPAAALAAYDQALTRDTKVGVKRRASRLRQLKAKAKGPSY